MEFLRTTGAERKRIRFTRGDIHGAWAGYAVDRIPAVSGSPSDVAAHEARVASHEQVKRV